MLVDTRPEHTLADPTLNRDVQDAYRVMMDYLVVNPDNASPIGPKYFDLVIITGSSRIEVPIHAALHLGDAPLVICSGKRGLKTKDWPRTEGATFKDIFEELRSGNGIVEAEEEAENGDRNYLNSIKRGEEILGRSMKDVGIYCLKPIQRRFDFFHRIYGGCDRIILFSPPLLDYNKLSYDRRIVELGWRLRLAAGEINRLDWMKSKYPTLLASEEIPIELFVHKRNMENFGFDPRPVATQHLFNK